MPEHTEESEGLLEEPQHEIRQKKTRNELYADHPRVELLADARDVVDVEVEMGRTGVRYFITFDGPFIPSNFHDHHGLEFVAAHPTNDRHNWWEYLGPSKDRLVGVYREPDDNLITGERDSDE